MAVEIMPNGDCVVLGGEWPREILADVNKILEEANKEISGLNRDRAYAWDLLGQVLKVAFDHTIHLDVVAELLILARESYADYLECPRPWDVPAKAECGGDCGDCDCGEGK